jgi:hypothetical protein
VFGLLIVALFLQALNSRFKSAFELVVVASFHLVRLFNNRIFKFLPSVQSEKSNKSAVRFRRASTSCYFAAQALFFILLRDTLVLACLCLGCCCLRCFFKP